MHHDVHSEQFGKYFMKNLPCQLFDQHHQFYLKCVQVSARLSYFIAFLVVTIHLLHMNDEKNVSCFLFNGIG